MNKLLTDQENSENRIKKLRYQSWHRGWKETDLILGRFADENLAKMDASTLDIYEQLLDENDADIWDWLVGKAQPKHDFYTPILQDLLEYGKYKQA
jgi:antitoxin CptB